LQLVEDKLAAALTLLQEAVELSITCLLQGVDKRAIGALWSEFIARFFALLKQKSKQSGENLLQYVRLPRM